MVKTAIQDARKYSVFDGSVGFHWRRGCDLLRTSTISGSQSSACESIQSDLVLIDGSRVVGN